MGNFRVFEDMVEELFESKLSRLLGGRLHPLEIANILAKALEDGQVASSNGHFLAPNRLTVFVNPEDYKTLCHHIDILQEELALYVTCVAAQNGLSIIGSLRVAIRQLPSIPVATSRVSVYLDAPGQATVTQGTKPMKTTSH